MKSNPKNVFSLWLKASADERLLATHMSLFSALWIAYHLQKKIQPFQVSRKKLMSCSKIASTRTYHKCIRELIESGYILYEPSYHPLNGSEVQWVV